MCDLGLAENLAWAQKAVAHVDKVLPTGALNKPSADEELAANLAQLSDVFAWPVLLSGKPATPHGFPKETHPGALEHRHAEGKRLSWYPVLEEAAHQARDKALPGLRTRFQCVKAVIDATGNPQDYDSNMAWLTETAKHATKHGCGNSGQQNAVAFEFLKAEFTKAKIKVPIDFLGVEPRYYQVFDHDFIVIGRLKGSRLKQLDTWGKEAVICDPWWPVKANRAYAAASLKQKMRSDIEAMLEVFTRWEG
jgi:hypothetical protein